VHYVCSILVFIISLCIFISASSVRGSVFSADSALASSSASDRPKIGLVLSGGGARGFAHIGTLKLIDSLQIPIDFIAGTSMGGIGAALYASGYSGREIEQLALQTDWTELFTDRPPRTSLPFLQKKDDGKFQVELGIKNYTPVIPSGLLVGHKINLLLSDLTSSTFGTSNFDDLNIPFRCVTVDLISGREVILDRGSLARAMRATMAIPTLFTPVEWGDSLLVDGGLLNNFPADIVKKMGADVILGVNVGTPLASKDELNSIISILNQTMIITDFEKQRQNAEMCEFVIRPDLKGLSTTSFDDQEVRQIIDQGIASAKASLDQFNEFKSKYVDPYPISKLQKSANSLDKTSRLSASGLEKDKPLKIFGIQIYGNEQLPYLFIYRLLGLNPSELFDKHLLRERIAYMYGLGYFEKIEYELTPVSRNAVKIVLHVKEKPVRSLRIGFRYDDEYKLIGIIGIRATNIPLPGLRIESNIEFAGLFRFDYTASYPSRRLNLPIIPYFRIRAKDVPIDIYDPATGIKLVEYDDRGISGGIGIGILLDKNGIVEVEYQQEQVYVEPDIGSLSEESFPSWNERLKKLQGHLRIDKLDDPIIPRTGLLMDLIYDARIKQLDNAPEYHQLQGQVDYYHSPSENHTLHFQAFATSYLKDVPRYKYPLRGGPHNFVGFRYNQLEGPQYGYVRLDYRFGYKKDIFFKTILNGGVFDGVREFSGLGTNFFYGYGLGVKLLSIIGPVELIISRGSNSIKQTNKMNTKIYISHGFVF